MIRAVINGLSLTLALLPNLILIPALLSEVGVNFTAAYTATVLMSALGAWFLGALPTVPSVALTLWLVYGEIISRGTDLSLALTLAFLSSCLGLLILKIRPFFSSPRSIRWGLVCGLGLTLIFHGLIRSRLVVAAPFGVTAWGNLSDPAPFFALLGLIVTLGLLVRRCPYALLLGALTAALLSWLEGFWLLPEHFFAWPAWPTETFLSPEISGWEEAWGLIPAFLLVQLVLPSALLEAVGAAKVKSRSLRLMLLSGCGNLCGLPPLTIAAEGALTKILGPGGTKTAAATFLLLALFSFCAPLAEALCYFPAMFAPIMVGGGILLCLRGIKSGEKFSLGEKITALTLTMVLPLSHNLVTALGAAYLVRAVCLSQEKPLQEIPPQEWIPPAIFALYFYVCSPQL